MKPVVDNNLNRTSLKNLANDLKISGGKILLIQTAFLGDVILVTPLINALRKLFPRAEIHIVLIPQCQEILSNSVDRVIIFDKRDRANRKAQWLKLIDTLKSERYQLALIPHRSLRSALTARKAEIAVRIGFAKGPGKYIHTHLIQYQRNLYEGKRNLALLSPLCEYAGDGLPKINPDAKDISVVENLLAEMGVYRNQFVAMAPGAVWKTKRWHWEYYRSIARLIKQEQGLQVVTVGGSEDAELCSRIVDNKTLNFAGRLTPSQSAILISLSKLLISGDSAPAHLATAVDARQVIIFGSTSPRFGFGPLTANARILNLDLWCQPCTSHGRNFCPRFGSFKCLRDLTPEVVFERIRDWLL